jgi:ubiquinone/menaquinone biosynthesis C-methylase UbiE
LMLKIETLYDELRSYKLARVLSMAIKLGLLHSLVQKSMTIEMLAEEKKLSSNTIKIFLNVLRNFDLVSYSLQFYTLTETGHQAAHDVALHSFAGYHEHCFSAWELLPEFCSDAKKSGMGFHRKQIKNQSFCEAYLKSMDAIAKKQLNAIESICEPLITGNLLDIGAGPSVFGRFLAEKMLCNVTAIDFPEVIDTAKKLYGAPAGFDWLGMDFMQYFPKQLFNIAYCSHVLEYLSGEQLDKWLEHVRNVLVPNGKVIFVCFLRDENPDSLQLELDMFELSTCLNGSSIGQVVSESQIKKILKKSGYEDIIITALPSGPSYGEYLITCTV